MVVVETFRDFAVNLRIRRNHVRSGRYRDLNFVVEAVPMVQPAHAVLVVHYLHLSLRIFAILMVQTVPSVALRLAAVSRWQFC